MAAGKNIAWKKNGKGKQYHLPYNIEAVGRNIKWGRERTFLGRKSRFKIMGMGKSIKF